MHQISTLDLKEFLTNAIGNVFDMMLAMEAEFIDLDFQTPAGESRIVGTVSFAGKVMGNINIQVNDAFARVMTAAILDMELDELEGEEEIYDVIGEVSNMIGGGLKSRLCDAGCFCELSIPSITSGNNYKIESKNWVRHESLTFCCGPHTGRVEVYIKLSS
jgi:CheY-specific phosphatase CheX